MKNGFTLIELLVVVLIIGILAAVALPQYQKAVLKARYVQLMTASDSIARAEELFYLGNGEYTGDLTALDIEVPHDKFSFYVDVRPDGHGAVVADRSDLGMGYVVYFQKHYNGTGAAGARHCRVYKKTDDVLKQLCQNMTGNTGGDAGPYISYTFK